MEIFISYRRGGPDQPHAGRVHDWLRTVGYQSYYDHDEDVNPVAEAFPDTIRQALRSCRVIIAVISESWIAQAHRLADRKDWVRRELMNASPDYERCKLLPLYINTRPDQLPDLPEDLAFIKGAHSYVWQGFEQPEKDRLLKRLRVLLRPAPRAARTPGDRPQVELLCDRARATGGFKGVLKGMRPLGRPGACILFGEQGQGHHDIFTRIQEFELKHDPELVELFPNRQMILLKGIDDYFGYRDVAAQRRDPGKIDEIDAEVVFPSVARDLKAGVRSYRELRDRLADKKVDLCVLYAVVRVRSAAQAQWWLSCFRQLHERLPAVSGEGPDIVLAFAMIYPTLTLRDLAAHLSLLLFFRGRYPGEFRRAGKIRGRPLEWPGLVVRRLEPVHRNHLEEWVDDPHVRDHIQGIDRELLLEVFKVREQQPMETVMRWIKRVLKDHLRSAEAGIYA